MGKALFDDIHDRLKACVDHSGQCKKCNYGGNCLWTNNPSAVAATTLALLSRTEPRVLDWDEVNELCSRDERTALYLEVMGDAVLYVANTYFSDGESHIAAADMRLEALIDINPGLLSPEAYGMTWRLWDGRPTNERRNAQAWD